MSTSSGHSGPGMNLRPKSFPMRDYQSSLQLSGPAGREVIYYSEVLKQNRTEHRSHWQRSLQTHRAEHNHQTLPLPQPWPDFPAGGCLPGSFLDRRMWRLVPGVQDVPQASGPEGEGLGILRKIGRWERVSSCIGLGLPLSCDIVGGQPCLVAP